MLAFGLSVYYLCEKNISMRKECLSVCFLLLSLMGGAREELPCRSFSDAKAVCDNGAVWNLSDAARTDRAGASYIIYGDTLVSETVDGLRRWYALTDEGRFFIREESRSFYIVPDSVMTCGTGAECEFTASGLLDNIFPLSRRGTHSCEGPFEGKIVVTTNDTIPARMMVERFEYEEKVSPTFEGFIPADSLKKFSRHSVALYRWFVPGRQLPVAVRSVISAGKEESTVTYVYDFSEGLPESEILKREIIKESLAGATVAADGGKLRLRLNAPLPFEIHVDIMTEGGISYHHSEHSVDGVCELEISAPGLPSGRYICAVSCDDLSEKRLLTIK